jgi:PhoH-like ATPase
MIQGISVLEGEILIVDEVQLVTKEYMSMILSRMSEGSKLFLLGDLHQTYKTIKKEESGLAKLLEVLPHESLAHIDLVHIYRNKLTELAMKLI